MFSRVWISKNHYCVAFVVIRNKNFKTQEKHEIQPTQLRWVLFFGLSDLEIVWKTFFAQKCPFSGRHWSKIFVMVFFPKLNLWGFLFFHTNHVWNRSKSKSVYQKYTFFRSGGLVEIFFSLAQLLIASSKKKLKTKISPRFWVSGWIRQHKGDWCFDYKIFNGSSFIKDPSS